MRRLRYWLIRKLAGKDTVMINCEGGMYTSSGWTKTHLYVPHLPRTR